MFYVLDMRVKDVGGAVVPARLVQPAGLGPLGTEDDLRREPSLTFLLHGYNVNRPDGQAALLRLANSLPAAANGGVVAVLWPGDHWSRALSYSFEGNDADDSSAELARYIDRVIRKGTSLAFVSHSLGARVALGAISRLSAGAYPISQTCLMAPAIDDYSLANPKNYRDAVAKVGRVAVLASRRDNVLKLAYPAGDLLQAFLFFKKDSRGLALGYHGPRSYKASAVAANVMHEQIPEHRDSDHGDYVPGPAPNAEQISAAAFANDVIAGQQAPKYL